MAEHDDGTHVSHAEALQAWADVAYVELKEVARTYNRVVRYAELRTLVYEATGIRTNMLMQNWIGEVLELVAARAAEAEEPPITALCVRGDGTIGEGYLRAPRFPATPSTEDVEYLAAHDRQLCYEHFASDRPDDGGSPTLTPEVALRRRNRNDSSWLEDLHETGRLSVQDNVPFGTPSEVARLLGHQDIDARAATVPLDAYSELWFPHVYTHRGVTTLLSDDGTVLTLSGAQDSGSKKAPLPTHPYQIVFGYVQRSTGPKYLLFLGVFQRKVQTPFAEDPTYVRVASSISIANSRYSFTPETRARNDDQAAEDSPTDLALVVTFDRQMENGIYAVEDSEATVKTRGSAQAAFSRIVKQNYAWSCAVTGISSREFLVASHIVPWSEDASIRLDPSNGICLSTFVDRAFDTGYLAIRPDGITAVRWDRVVDDPILKSELARLDGVPLTRPADGAPDPEKLSRRLELDGGLGHA